LSFDSGYTTNVSTERPSCFTVTHSLWRGDFASFAFAQSCAETADESTRLASNAKQIRIFFTVTPSTLKQLEKAIRAQCSAPNHKRPARIPASFLHKLHRTAKMQHGSAPLQVNKGDLVLTIPAQTDILTGRDEANAQDNQEQN
jgi:hypothetical protein